MPSQYSHTLTLDIPKHVHASLIGKNGCIIKQLESNYNIKLVIPNKEDINNTVVIHSNDYNNLQKAKVQIETIVGKHVSVIENTNNPNPIIAVNNCSKASSDEPSSSL